MNEKQSNLSEGQGLAEYAIILVLVAVVVIIILAALGPAIGSMFSTILDNPFEVGIEIATPISRGSEGPADCYGSFLMPLMVITSGVVMLLSHYLPKKTKRIPIQV